MFKKFYDQYWEKKSLAITPHTFWKQKLIKKYTGKNKKVLDLGCGDCYLTEVLLGNNEITGIDISEISLSQAAKGVKKIYADLNKGIPLKDEMFDIVILSDILEHILEPIKLIREAKRVARVKALILFSVPNSLNILNRFYFLIGKFKDVTDSYHKKEIFSDHIRIFSKDILDNIIKSQNLKCISKYFYFPDKFQEWKKLEFFGKIVRILKLYKKMPSLFALSFFYITQKR